ncbi:hypothetical protein ABTF76_20200, partial [Acinetobacter baumannii]
SVQVSFARDAHSEPELVLMATRQAHGVQFSLCAQAGSTAGAIANRLWWRVPAQTEEHVWGCGEQMSYFDLRGRHFPLWTSEPGVGRDKSTYLTW